MDIIQKGDRGTVVKRIQKKVGVTADGIFGPKTKRAVQTWQAKHGLRADGIVGPLTYARMFPIRSLVSRPADLIVLDIGHGDNNRRPGVHDPGATAAGEKEHELATRLTVALAAQLRKRKRAVRITSDMHVSQRDDAAKKHAPVLFVSNHMNAGGGTGTEVLVSRKAPVRLRAKAAYLSSTIATVFGLRDRGVKTDTRGLAVLQAMPEKTLLIEWAFIDDPDDRRAVERFMQKAAEAAAHALVEG